jgi:nucleoside-triphosphatase THEP1
MPPTSVRTRRRPSPADDEPLVIERIPWSVLGPEFIAIWGRPRGKPQPEHLEILGPTGSGKSFLLVQILIERVRRRKTAVVFVATKQADDTVSSMGWPIVSTWREAAKHDQVVFWPRTKDKGTKRKAFQAARIQDLLDELWQPDANTVVVLDEIAYIEGLNRDLRDDVNMYLREGRSHGIELVMGKQRPQGIQRDMHSESDWKIAFKMNDRNDNERLAELFGTKKDWVPVIESLDRERHEFIIQHKLTSTQYISWVDAPVSPRKVARDQHTYRKSA